MKKFIKYTAVILILFLACTVFAIPALAASTGTITARSLNVRKTPSASGAYVTTLVNGTVVNVLEKSSGGWYKISYAKYTGYVSGNYLKISGTITVTVTGLKIGDESSAVTTLQTQLKTLGYFKNDVTGYYGQITASAVRAFQKANGLSQTGVADTKTRDSIASKAQTKSSTTITAGRTDITLNTGAKGEEVKKLQNALIKLRYFYSSATGYYGAITKTAVSDFQKNNKLTVTGKADPATLKAIYGSKTTSSSGSATTVSSAVTGRTDICLRFGTTNKEVANLQKALKAKGFFKVGITTYFGTVTQTAVKSFQKANSLTADGIAGSKTLVKLYGKVQTGDTSVKVSYSGSTKLVPWYGQMEKTFYRGLTVTVIDVKTGISFRVKRGGGSKHADSEPISKTDVSNMKRARGGSWGWSRRAIWVVINGTRYAASMNGMPHGGDFVSGNGFNGHFCIHFKNSRTHGTNRVDPDHQAMIAFAFNNG